MSPYRPVLVMLLVVLNGAAAVFCLLGASSWEDAGWAAFLALVFTPVKGITYRRLGAQRPFITALVATATWQIVGLPIDLDAFWTVLAASFVVSIAVDLLALLALASAPGPIVGTVLAVYGSAIVHLLTAGFFSFQRSPALGLPLLAAGAALFLLPAFFSDRFQPDAP